MPEAQECVIDRVRETVKKAKRISAEVAARVKGESKFSRSIENQKGPLKKIVEDCTDDNQVREANRMLNVIDYYEQTLQDSPEERQLRIRELEQALNDRVLFLWDTLPKYTKFNTSDKANPTYEILPRPQYRKEKKVDRWRRAGGYAAINLQELKGDEAERFKYVKYTRTGEGEIPQAFRAWQFYLEFQPRGEKQYRQVIIQLDPDPTHHSEDIFSASLTTHGRGLKRQDAYFKFDRTKDEIKIVSTRTMWQPTVIGNKEITGWDKYTTEVGDRDSQQVRLEKDALAFAIIQELFETTQISETEIKLLKEEKWTEVGQSLEKET